LSPRPDLVVISGDITTNSALPKKYEHAKTLLADALAALLERHPRALLVASAACPLCPRRPPAPASLPPSARPVPIGEFPGPYGSADTAPPRL
jgi:3',5'-cyclic AMP phosphodiesterase CpdA